MKSIRQRADEFRFTQAATLCSDFIVCSEPNSGKFETASAKQNSRATFPKFWFRSSPVRRFSFEEIPTEFVANIQNVRVKQTLQCPGLEIKIAACAKQLGVATGIPYLGSYSGAHIFDVFPCGRCFFTRVSDTRKYALWIINTEPACKRRLNYSICQLFHTHAHSHVCILTYTVLNKVKLLAIFLSNNVCAKNSYDCQPAQLVRECVVCLCIFLWYK